MIVTLLQYDYSLLTAFCRMILVVYSLWLHSKVDLYYLVHIQKLFLEAMHEPICEREQLFGANIYTQLVHMILLIGTTGI